MDMTDSDNRLVERFFQEAAQQEITDNGLTERVMQGVETVEASMGRSSLLCRLWTWFCILTGGILFFFLNGWEALKASLLAILETVLTSLSVFATTAPTTDLHLDPVLVLLAVAFVLVFLPYQTARRLSTTL